jgi:hypothetical protein
MHCAEQPTSPSLIGGQNLLVLDYDQSILGFLQLEKRAAVGG